MKTVINAAACSALGLLIIAIGQLEIGVALLCIQSISYAYLADRWRNLSLEWRELADDLEREEA